MSTSVADLSIESHAYAELTRLRHENRRLRLEAAGLRDAARLILEEPDVHRLAQALAQPFGEMLDAESAWVLVVQDEKTIAHGDWTRADAPSQGVPVSIHDLGRSAARDAVENLRMCTMLGPSGDYEIAAPIVDHQQRLLGLLQARNSRPFATEHLRATHMFAIQSALGLERTRLFDRTRDWTRTLEALLSFSAVMDRHIEPAEVVRLLVENAARFLEADGGRTGLAVAASAPGGKVMISDAYWWRGRWFEGPERWELDQGIPGSLLDRQISNIANDYRKDRRREVSLVADYDVRRSLCVPVKNLDESLYGFFQLLRGPGSPPFMPQDAALLESLGHAIAVGLHKRDLLRALQLKNEQIQALSAHHLERLESERTHIARELHDEAGQALVAIKLSLQVLARLVPPELQQLRDDFDGLRELVNKSTTQIKDLARRLRPPILDELGLNEALRQIGAEFAKLTGVPVECDLEDLPQRLPVSTETALYRIAQEALTNVARYANARNVELTLASEDQALKFSIRDDGAGFVPSAVGAGLGLLGMRERAGILHATFSLDTKPGEGTHITVTVPYDTRTHNPR